MIWRWTNSVATQQSTKPLRPSATFSLNCCFMSKLWRFSDNDNLRERQQSRVSANHVSTMCSTRDTRFLQCTFLQLAANEWLLDTMHQTAELHRCLFKRSCRIASFISCWEKHCNPASILSKWAILFLSLLGHTPKNAWFYNEAAYVIMKPYRNWTDWLQFPRQCFYSICSFSSELASTSLSTFPHGRMAWCSLSAVLTWPLVFDEEKLQPLLEGVFVHIELHLHPVGNGDMTSV